MLGSIDPVSELEGMPGCAWALVASAVGDRAAAVTVAAIKAALSVPMVELRT